MTVKLVRSVNFVNFHETVFSAKLFIWWHGSEILGNYCFIQILTGKIIKEGQKRTFQRFFGLIPFLKTGAVLDHRLKVLKSNLWVLMTSKSSYCTVWSSKFYLLKFGFGHCERYYISLIQRLGGIQQCHL